ncbi:MAG: hypothetical protein ACKVRN_17155 [Pyrinomonadaceae bacterium]
MINKSTLKRFACLSAMAAAVVLVSGTFSEISAQRDPFVKPSFMKVRPPAPVKSGTSASGMPVNFGPPAIEARIEYFKRLREAAALNGSPLPKVTSVLTLNEMAVTGIFKTPRGYAAMVEAVPIKLSYTVYPGEKFFDGQLVAVEDNRLVFRKVTKVGAGKFVASVENKPLKEYSQKAQIEGTAPVPAAERPVETASNNPSEKSESKDGKTPTKAKPASNPFLSPLDEMNKQPADAPTEKAKKPSKKPAKVARNKGN